MGKENFEQIMGVHAAPFLLGLRPSCLLSFQKSKFDDFEGMRASYRTCFQCKGISIFRVSEGSEHILLLFYRPAALLRTINQPDAKKLLADCGYREEELLVDKLNLLHLRMGMRKSFPHEIGIFLGYPPADVRGFIKNKGQAFHCAGYWKVYSNEQQTRALFDLYSICTHDFCAKLEHGIAFPELVQAV